ncbi:LptF/LptG family permease [Pelagibacterales bacterium SAG-MED41]|nr:LptF/LptG family permease [Pelagibacterales bacterium SAG-MED41]|tara:strand:+ start:1302 stop:2390 length:1089 start_codon:yes stop_codon:yes gene_type:complete
MNKIILNYILKNFLKSFFITVLIFYSFGIILNLFEEIEFFKNKNVSIITPLILTSIYIPSLIIKFLPFIIFVSSMWFMLKIRNNRDLLTLKVYGYSNIKIFFILAFTSFFLGWLILFLINPITSSLVRYYEQTKSNYSRDIDHLISFNKNGLWIKENTKNGSRIISASRPEDKNLIDVTIFHLDKNYRLEEKIISQKADISSKNWILNDVKLLKNDAGLFKLKEIENYEIESIYDYEKINNLFRNFDTMSFIDLLLNYNKLKKEGYNKNYLDQSLHSLLVIPFFLFIMTALASILTLNTLKKSDSFKFIALGLILTVIIYYIKDLSLALGQIDRIPLILSVWSPIIAISLFTFVGVLQINEK